MASPSEMSWPEMGDELARKSTEQLARIVHLLDLGKINKGHAFFALDVLVEATQGLVPDDAWHTLYQALKEIRKC